MIAALARRGPLSREARSRWWRRLARFHFARGKPAHGCRAQAQTFPGASPFWGV